MAYKELASTRATFQTNNKDHAKRICNLHHTVVARLRGVAIFKQAQRTLPHFITSDFYMSCHAISPDLQIRSVPGTHSGLSILSTPWPFNPHETLRFLSAEEMAADLRTSQNRRTIEPMPAVDNEARAKERNEQNRQAGVRR